MDRKPGILIVDDEEIFRTFIADTLRFFGHDYVLQTAVSGSDALKIIEQNSADIDVVLLDVAMPPPNGFEVLKQIKENPLARQMKVIMLTATHQVENKIKAFSSGAADYISKPFEAEELIARIETQLALKKSEGALRESEARYRVLAENASDLIAKITLDGIYTYVSPASLAVLGYKPEELIGQSYYNLIHPDDLIEIKGMNPPLLDPTTSSVFALRFKKNDGDYIWLETSLRTIHSKNAPATEVIAVARDITERKIYEAAVQRAYAELEHRVEYRTDQLQKSNAQLTQEIAERKRVEAALEKERASLTCRVEERTIELRVANEELSRAARLKDEFLASMSHELRTPLNAVLGMSEALQEQVYGPLNEMQLKSLATIEESGRHLLALINDILDLSKIEAGKLVLDITSTPVESICQASLRFIKQDAHKKRLKISSIFDSQVRTIQVDERRLKQILVNLLSNAVKFTPEEGEIGLEVRGDPTTRMAHFIVWDTGIGIAPQNIGRLFQPFVQLDSRLSRRYSGTGLGLALVQRMVEMHYGKISVESEEGKGSRFTISLPWLPEGKDDFVADQADEDFQLPNLTGLHRVLVVEDSPVVIDQYTRYFQELGIELAVHLRGSNVIEKALVVQPDIIILDLLLPDQYGWDVLTELKTDRRLKHIPIIIASVTDERTRGLAMGATEYLVKPLSRAKLQKALALAIAPGKTRILPAPAPAPISSPGQSARILLAEDNQINIFTISQYLKQKGYQLLLAQNGLEAIEQAQNEAPNLILMDIQMPDMDGLEAIRRIKANPQLATIPIIALTALAMPGDRERCLQAGANNYLSKPVNLKSLLQAIETHLKS